MTLLQAIMHIYHAWYSQTCSNDHLFKKTNTKPAQANPHAIVTV